MTMHTTSAAFLPGGMTVGSPWEAWRLGWMVSELWMTSAYDILSRTQWLAGTDPTQAAAGREWQRMWSEKLAAGLEVAMEAQRAGYDLWFGQFDPRFNPWQSGLQTVRPAHPRTTANARRRDLQRT